jgi:hypothetical protein
MVPLVSTMWEFLHLPTEEDELEHTNWNAHTYGSIGSLHYTCNFGYLLHVFKILNINRNEKVSNLSIMISHPVNRKKYVKIFEYPYLKGFSGLIPTFLHLISFIQQVPSYTHTFILTHSPRSISISSLLGGTSMGCRSGIRTRACLTASRPTDV